MMGSDQILTSSEKYDWGSGDEKVAKYLQGCVGKALAEGLSATFNAKPKEPLLFLSRWLLRHVEESKRRSLAAESHKAMCASRASATAKREAEATAAAAASSRLDERGLSKSDREVLEKLRGAKWMEEGVIVELLNHLKETLGATGVYLAKYEDQVALRDGDMVPGLRYVYANQDHAFMLNNCLLEDEGVTWTLLHEAEGNGSGIETSQVSEVEEEGEEKESSEIAENGKRSASAGSSDGSTAQDVRHKLLYVEEVMDDPRVRFFGLTRPGCYAAVSIEFNDVANADAVSTLCKWKQQKHQKEAIAAARESADAVKLARRDSEGSLSEDEGGDAFDEGEEEEDDVGIDDPLPPVELPSTATKYILCADLLGKGKRLQQTSLCCLQTFAKEMARAFVKTQREAVEKQAEELFSGSERQAVAQEFAQLQQKSSERLGALTQQRQAEALQQLKEEEAEEAREREIRRERAKTSRMKLQTSREMEDDDGTAKSSLPLVDEESWEKEQSEEDEEPSTSFLRELVSEAAAAGAAFEAFNEDVLKPFKTQFSLSQRYIADSQALLSAAASCALLLGHKPKTLKENPVNKDSQWSWNNLRRLITPFFADAMLAFNPKAPRHYTEKENSLQFINELLESENRGMAGQAETLFESLLYSWASLAVIARQKELMLYRERLRWIARMQHAPPPQLDQLDSDFKYLEEEDE